MTLQRARERIAEMPDDGPPAKGWTNYLGRYAVLSILDEELADDLGAAWAAAEAALPEGWWVHVLHAWSFDDMAYRAEAVAAGHEEYISTAQRDKPFGTRRFVSGPSVDAYGPTPAAALLALAAALRERP